MPGSSEHFQALSFRKDGSFSVAASTLTGNVWDGSLCHFDSYRHFCGVPNLRMYSNVITSGVNDIQWYNSTKLLLAVDQGDIEIWECQSPGNTLERVNYLTGAHHDMALSLGVLGVSDGSAGGDVISGGGDGKAIGWDLAALKKVFCYNAHLGWLTSLATAPTQSSTFVTTGMDHFMKVWDKRNQRPLIHKIAAGEVCNVSVAWSSREDNIFATGSEVGAVSVFDLRMLGRGQTTPLLSYSSHCRAVHRLAFSPRDSKMLASVSDDCTVHLHQIDFNSTLLTSSDHHDYIHGLAWHPDGSFLLTAGWDGKILRHSLENEKEQYDGNGDKNEYSKDGVDMETDAGAT